MPTYVLHHPRLTVRRAQMEFRLKNAHVADVTWLLCANRENVENLSFQSRQCLIQLTPSHRSMLNSNGTISLAIKHLLAYADIRSRNLTAALVLEDDAAVPANLWALLAEPFGTIPPDAEIFWLGGGHRNANFDHHKRLNDTFYCGDANRVRVLSGSPTNRLNGTYCVYERKFSMPPIFIAAHAYIMTRRGAQSWRGWPVRAPADLVLSRGDLLCRSYLGTQQCHLWKQYGPARWFVIQQSIDGRSHNNPIELLRQHGWASSDGLAAWTLATSPAEPLPRGGQQSHETEAAAAAGCTNVLMKVHGSDDVTLCAYGASDADPASEEIRRHGRLAECETLVSTWVHNTTARDLQLYVEVGSSIGACAVEMLLRTEAAVAVFESNPSHLFHVHSTLRLLAAQLPQRHLAERVIVFPITLSNESRGAADAQLRRPLDVIFNSNQKATKATPGFIRLVHLSGGSARAARLDASYHEPSSPMEAILGMQRLLWLRHAIQAVVVSHVATCSTHSVGAKVGACSLDEDEITRASSLARNLHGSRRTVVFHPVPAPTGDLAGASHESHSSRVDLIGLPATGRHVDLKRPAADAALRGFATPTPWKWQGRIQ